MKRYLLRSLQVILLATLLLGTKQVIAQGSSNAFEGTQTYTMPIGGRYDRIVEVSRYQSNRQFFTYTDRNGPAFVFKHPAPTPMQSDNGIDWNVHRSWYVLTKDGAVDNPSPDNVDYTFSPSPDMAGKNISLLQQIQGQWKQNKGFYAQQVDNMGSLTLVVEGPGFVNKDNIKNVCNNQSFAISDYFTNVPDVDFYVDGTLTNRFNAYQLSLGSHTISAQKNYDNGLYFESIQVNVIAQPTAVITPSGATDICEGSTITLSAPDAPAGQTWTYLWSSRETSKSITTSNATDYTVTVSNGICSAVSPSVKITKKAVPDASINIVGSTNMCDGDQVVLTAANAASYGWFKNGTLIPGENGQSLVVTSAGSYNAVLTGSNGCNTTTPQTVVTVKTNPKPTILVTGFLEFCDGGSVTLTAQSSVIPSSYSWSDGQTGQTVTIKKSGVITVTVNNPGGCQAVSLPVVVNVKPNPKPVITPSGSTNICLGENVTLTSTPASSYLWSDGSTGQKLVAAVSGNYSVTVTNNNGCQSTSDVMVVTVKQRPVATISASRSTSLCSGESVILTASNGDAWLWSSGEATQSINASQANDYTVTVFKDGCSSTSAVTKVKVNVPVIPTITVSGSLNPCVGETVTLTASDGVSQTWSDGQTSKDIQVTQSGLYFVTVKDANGCSSVSASVKITFKPIFSPVITITGETNLCQGSSVILTATSGKSYLWSSGETTQSIEKGLSAAYSCVVTNNQGCSVETPPVVVTIKSAPIPIIAVTGGTSVCEGSSSRLTVANPVSGAQYLWSNGVPGNSIPVTEANQYTVSAQYSNGCSATSDPVIIKVLPISKPTISASTSTVICEGQSITLTINETATSYRWSDGSQGKQLTTKLAGSYIAYTKNADGCERASDPVIVTVKDNKIAAISIFGQTEFCEGQNAVLTASAGASFKWSSGENTRDITVTRSGTYSCEITNASGCTSTTADVIIKVNPIPKPTIKISGPLEFCDGGSVKLTINQVGTSYRWSDGTIGANNITVKSSGTYIGYITNAQGCERESEPIEVIVKPVPNPVLVASGPTTFCAPKSVVLSVPLVTGYTYSWSNGITGTSTITVNETGSYYVTVTNTLGCSTASNIIDVTVNPNPVPIITPSGALTFCSGESVTLTSSPAASYFWPATNETTQSIKVSASGTFIVETTTDQGCKNVSSAVAVTVNPVPDATISVSGPTIFCAPKTITLSVPLVTGNTYLWSNDVTGTNKITVDASGSYYVTITNTLGCVSTSKVVVVTVNPNPVPIITPLGALTFCSGESVTLSSSPAASYFWPATNETTQSIKVSAGGDYKVETTTAFGCKNISQAITVVVNPRTPAKIIASGVTTFCEGNSIVLTANPGMSSYLWNTGETTDKITVYKTDKYSVTITNQFGCQSTSDEMPVKVLEKPKPTITALGVIEFCQGGSVVLQASEGKYFLWSNGEKSQKVTISKTSTLTVTITNELGCSETSAPITVTVNQPTALTAITDFQACINGGIVTLNKEDPKGGKYSGDGITDNKFNPQVAGLGNHTIVYTYINDKGCQSVTTFNIEVTPLTVITPGADLTICEKDEPVLLLITSVPPGTIITGTGVQDNKFYPGTAGLGKHTISYVFKNTYGCTSTAEQLITVTAVPDPVTVTGVMSGCNFNMITLTAASAIKGNGSINFNWYRQGDLQPFFTGRILDYMVTKNESIYVSASSDGTKTCTSKQTEVKITSLNPVGDFTVNAQRIPLAGLTKFTPAVTGATTYAWDFGDGQKSTDQAPVHYYYKAGKYKVTMSAFSAEGCPLIVTKVDYITVDTDPIVPIPPDNKEKPIIQDKGNKDMVIFPIPITEGTATLKFFNSENKSLDVIVEIYTVSGKLLSRVTYGAQSGPNEISLRDINILTASTYYLFRVQINNESKSFKVLIL